MDALPVGSDILLPAKCVKLLKAVTWQLIQEGRLCSLWLSLWPLLSSLLPIISNQSFDYNSFEAALVTRKSTVQNT